DGTLSAVAEEPPAALLDRFRAVGALPLEPAQRAEFVGALATRFAHLRRTLAAHSRVYPAALSVVLDLRPDDWLQVRVFAQGGSPPWQPGAAPVAGAVLFEHVPARGWVRHDPATAAPETGRIADATSAAAAADTPAPAHEQAGAPHDQAQPAEVWIEAPD